MLAKDLDGKAVWYLADLTGSPDFIGKSSVRIDDDALCEVCSVFN